MFRSVANEQRHFFLRVVHAFKNYGRDSKKRLDRTSEFNTKVYFDSFSLTNRSSFSVSKELTIESSQQSKER